METEEKAKVVASVWGTEFIHFLATLATYFASVDLEEKDEFNLLFLFHPSSMAYSDPLQSYVENSIIHYMYTSYHFLPYSRRTQFATIHILA